MALSDKLVEILPTLETLAHAKEEDLEVDDRTRERLYSAARKLMLRLEIDAETMQRIDLAPMQLGIIKLAYDVNLFTALADNGEKTLAQLAVDTKVDPALLSRILKYCSAHGMVDEVGLGEYKANRMTRSFAAPGFHGAVISHHATTMRAAQALPEYLAKSGYIAPNDPKNGILQLGIGSDDSFFEYLHGNPPLAQAFNAYMAAVRMSQKHLGKLYDFDNLWGADTEEESVLFVDVGGGSGHQCISLLKTTDRKGRLILQDLPEVVKDLVIENVEIMPHSFFNEQPVRGAKAYYFRTILHDWSDDDCRVILKHIHEAMDANSVLLIDERIIADKDAHWIAMNMDLAMMLLLAAGERTEKQWTDLLESVSFKIKNIIRYSASGSCIIEAIKN